MATIKQSVLQDIRDDQNFTSSYNAQPTSYLDKSLDSNLLLTEDPYLREQRFWEERKNIEETEEEGRGLGGNAYDFVSHGLWNLADTASFGALDWMDIDHLVWGAEYGSPTELGQRVGQEKMLDMFMLIV